MVLLSVLSNILASMDQFTRTHQELLPEELLAPYVDLVTVKTDEQRMAENGRDQVNPNDFASELTELVWLFPETTKNVDKLVLQYKGCCAYSLVKHDRLLLPGNPDLGILQYKEKFYIFSSLMAAHTFAAEPAKYIDEVAEAAKKSPELIQLLELHQQFSSLSAYSSDDKKLVVKPVTKSDCGSQTVTHIEPRNMVKGYEWNEWELRRKALKLTNLRTKLTKASQTKLSNIRRENSSQVYLPKDQLSQTKADGKSNVPRPTTFLAGLRGCRAKGHFVKFDLTRPVEEWP